MTPERKTIIDGHEIAEYYWTGKMVTYVDHRLWDGTYQEAIDKLLAGEGEDGNQNPD